MTGHTPSTRPYADPADRFLGTDIGFDFYEKTTGELHPIRHVPAPTQEIGTYVPEKQGFYEGRWQPKDKDGVPYGKLLDVYSSPEDLTDKKGQRLVTSFKKAVKATAKVKNFHGRDGAGFKSEEDLIKAVIEGDSEKLQKLWIPTKDILRDMLYENHRAENVPSIMGIHWSSTLAGIESENKGGNPKDFVYAIDLSAPNPFFIPRVGGSTYKPPKSEFATRPVWAELVAEF